MHQLHTAIFTEECGVEKITPIMYSVLSALANTGSVDQTTLACSIAIDKTNMADVLERLRKRGLIRRRTAPKDRRVRLAALTSEGHALLDRVDEKAERAHLRTIEDLSSTEQETFLDYMNRIISAKDGAAQRPGKPG
jgi:DNA-binding MarR family transcriptional regulator